MKVEGWIMGLEGATMRSMAVAFISTAFLAGLGAQASAQVKSNDNKIAVMDNCDPTDPAWAGLGGCALKDGSVSVAEFDELLFSPLSGTIPVGHPSWRNEPSYISPLAGKTVRVTNWGGRDHTFTEVADFGGGFVPPLNGTLVPAPECDPASVIFLPPGATQKITGLGVGTHKFQCCIHPWMRAAVEVK